MQPPWPANSPISSAERSPKRLAVADALDAMTSDRPYRRARTWEAATAEIASEVGRQFDPSVVEAFQERSSRLRRIHYELSAGANARPVPSS